MATAVAAKGLEGIVAANSGICWIDGDAGVLAYRGVDIHELAEKSTFEETACLLWNGKLPNKTELDEFSKKLAAARTLPPPILDLLRSFPKTATPMEVLRTAVSALSMYDASEKAVDHDSNIRKSFALTAQVPMLVAAFDRIRKGKDVITPDSSLSHAANFLWLLNISTTVALGLAWAENPAAQNSVQAFVARGNLFAAALESEILVAMVALSANANLPWKTHVAKIARGLGVYSLVSVMFECAQSYTGTSRMLPTLSTLNHVLISVYLSCVVYWIISLSRNEQPARVMTPEMREKVFALGSQLAYDLQDLQSRKKS